MLLNGVFTNFTNRESEFNYIAETPTKFIGKSNKKRGEPKLFYKITDLIEAYELLVRSQQEILNDERMNKENYNFDLVDFGK